MVSANQIRKKNKMTRVKMCWRSPHKIRKGTKKWDNSMKYSMCLGLLVYLFPRSSFPAEILPDCDAATSFSSSP